MINENKEKYENKLKAEESQTLNQNSAQYESR
jgi:hypothetical protein